LPYRLQEGRLAQLEERLVYTQEVGSSSLSPPTNKSSGLVQKGRRTDVSSKA
jgi:hypothetical protein